MGGQGEFLLNRDRTEFQFGMMESSGNGWWWWWSHKGVSRRGAPNFILKRVKKGKFHVVYISRQ